MDVATRWWASAELVRARAHRLAWLAAVLLNMGSQDLIVKAASELFAKLQKLVKQVVDRQGGNKTANQPKDSPSLLVARVSWLFCKSCGQLGRQQAVSPQLGRSTTQFAVTDLPSAELSSQAY
jgi:hypothetical protein